MNFRPISILRWALPALLILGLSGLGGCTHRYHPQYAHALGGGGAIGKGPSSGTKGKKRGIAQNESASAFGATSKATSNPFASPGGSSPRKPAQKPAQMRAQPSLARPPPAPGTRPKKSPQTPSLFDSGNKGAGKRADDPFKGF